MGSLSTEHLSWELLGKVGRKSTDVAYPGKTGRQEVEKIRLLSVSNV